MRVQIATRHCEVPNSVLNRTEERIRKLSRYEPRISGAEIVFETEKHLKRAEAILKVDRGEPVLASGEGAEFREALDQMTDRLSRILKRRKSLKKDRHRGGGAPAVPPAD